MQIILLLFYFLIVTFLPYIVGIIISVISICLIRKRMSGKKQKVRLIVYVIVIVIFLCVCFKLNPLWYKYASARPDSTYIEMKKINDNKSLIGLSKEQVVELLGEPTWNYTTKNGYDDYYYNAGKIINYITGGNRKLYEFQVCFDENNIVRFTSIDEKV